VAAVALAIVAFFLALFPLRHLRVPVGWDSVDYIWRTRLAQMVGISNIREAVPPRMFVKEARPAFIVVAATLSSLGHVSVISVTMVIPAVVAAAAGLAGGALVRFGSGLPWWSFPAGAIVVGTSMNAVLMVQYGYIDNLMMTAVFLVAALAALAAIERRGALIPAIFLLGVGGLIHGALFALAMAVIALAAMAYVPSSWRRWRSGVPALDTPAGRLGQVFVGGGVVAAGALYVTFKAGPSPRLNRGELGKKLRDDLPRYHLPWLLTLAGLGAVWLGRESRGADPRATRRRSLLTLLVAWAGVALLGYVAYRVTTLPVPANRFLLFGLAVPILALLGVIGVGQVASRLWKPLQVILVVAAVAGAVLVSFREWHRTVSYVDPAKLQQAAVAEAYLSATGVPTTRPVVFIVDDRGPLPAANVPFMRDHLLAVLPTDRLRNVYVYLGAPEDFVAGIPTANPPSRQYQASSRRLFSLLQPVLDEDPVALIVESYNKTFFGEWVRAHPESRVDAGPVAVVQGPPPPSGALSPRTAIPSSTVPKLTLLALGSLGVMGLVGLGWSVALVGPWLGSVGALAVSPAVGLAVLILGGALADRAGIRLAGAGGILTPIVLAVAGVTVALAARRRTPTVPPLAQDAERGLVRQG
jgi:hypothetical protein